MHSEGSGTSFNGLYGAVPLRGPGPALGTGIEALPSGAYSPASERREKAWCLAHCLQHPKLPGNGNLKVTRKQFGNRRCSEV